MRQKANLRLQKKYNRLFRKLQQALQSGQFLTYSAARKARLLARLQSYENRLLRKGVAVLGTAALLMSGGEVLGQQPVRVGEEFRVNECTQSLQELADVAMNKDGSFVVVWQSSCEGQDGHYSGIYARRFDESGMPLGSEFQVNTYISSFQFHPSIAMDEDGDFVIVWQSGPLFDNEGTPQDGSYYGVYGQRYRSNGQPVGEEFQVNTYTTGIQGNPSIAMDDDGDFLVAWEGFGIDSDNINFSIYGQRYDKNGNRLGAEFKISSNDQFGKVDVEVEMDKDGNSIAVWRSLHQDGDSWGIFGQVIDKDGNFLGKEFSVNDYSNGSQSGVSIGIGNDQSFIVTWSSYDEMHLGSYAKKFDSILHPNNTNAEFQVHANGHISDIVKLDNDVFVMLLQAENREDDSSDLYLGLYQQNEGFKSLEIPINSQHNFKNINASLGISEDNNLITIWQSDQLARHSFDVYGQLLKLSKYAIPNINTLIFNTCTRPYFATFDAVPDAIGYQVQITVLARNGEVITRRIDDNEISGNFNIPRRLLGTDVKIQIAAIFLDDETGEEIVGEFSETGTFTLGCDEADNLVLESRN